MLMNSQELIARYAGGYQAVVDALEGIGEGELDARPGAEDWTPREIVHHLADSETTSAIRLRRLLAEEAPVITGYDEREFARVLHYDRPIESSLEVLKAVRRSNTTLLERLSSAEWQRAGTHSESGPYSVEIWLQIYARHAHDHAEQIRRARRSARP
jgi:hypothetical protein